MAGISAVLAVTSEDREKLERLARSGKTEQRVAFRSRIVLQAAKGWSNSAIAEALGTSRPTVIGWRKRYEAEGIAGLSHDRPRGRSFQPIARNKEAEVIEKTLHSTPAGSIDKDEGFVKAQSSCAVRLHRMNCREVEDQSSGRFTLHHQTVGYAPPTIDTAINHRP